MPKPMVIAGTEHVVPDGPRLGRLPSKADTRALHFSRFLSARAPSTPPPATNFWRRRSPFAPRTFGNLQMGNCTIAKQAVAHLRMERIEQRRTTTILDAEPIRVYMEMSEELYGGGDNGAYETDALDRWRRQDKTFKDYKGRALTIDAYTRLNPYDHDEVRTALALAGAHGLAVCFNLPLAWAYLNPPARWDIPEGQPPLVGPWMPGSWGGHSMWAVDYDEDDLIVAHTWDQPDQRVSWKACAAYMDEVHLVIDSVNWWKAHKAQALRFLDLAGIKTAVNKVSDVKIA